MDLILVRHGNTFEDGEKPVWVGSAQDPELTSKGVRQAEEVAAYLRTGREIPGKIYYGPLRRTREFAATIAQNLHLSAPKVDNRLVEIDYGAWSGLSTDEIRCAFGDKEIDDWEIRSKWPTSGVWPGSERDLRANIRSIEREILAPMDENSSVLMVTSNGILRYFLELIPGEFERRISSQDFKMKTGAVSKLRRVGREWRLSFWNVRPSSVL